ncbi:MAG: TonB-dependent receptor [Alphaproteobacteria bacterium]|nr:TonB-dependent receptor [Alphaproteobacteria bacterium]
MTSNFKTALLCATSLLGLTTVAYAQESNVESVTVTGSRLISDITASPTPITAVTADQLQATTPTNIPDALNKLPTFIGGRTPRSQDNASRNTSGNVLSLRNFGVSRTLILLDGHRVAPSNEDGTVDTDVLPQILMTRVDVVTGGASAVYGSDAVAGVVNFILDKKFEGYKYNLNAGISKYQDAAEFNFGQAWGTALFGGRGHIEVATRYFQQDMVPITARPYGDNGQAWVQSGSGSRTAPFTNTPYGRTFNRSELGLIVCGSTCAANNSQFGIGGGNISPATHGVPTTTSNLESGGDGGYDHFGTFKSGLRQAEAFTRMSYDLTDDINAYVQGSWAESHNYAIWFPTTSSSAGSTPNSYFANNPFLSAAAQTQLRTSTLFLPTYTTQPTGAVGGGTPPPPPVDALGPVPIFRDQGYVFNNIGGKDAGLQNYIYRTKGQDKYTNIEAGLTGSVMNGRFNWDLYFNHGDSRVKVENPNNTNNAKFLAAADAVKNADGTVSCWVSTQAAYASLYPGCQPLNLFNPQDGPSAASYRYITQSTSWVLSQTLDDVGGSVAGGLGFGLPAGEISVALSGEARWATYTMQSNALPTDFVNCTGLRLCLANGNAPPLWAQNVNAPVDVDNNVYEFALETNIPLLKDLPFAQRVSVDLAGRYTDYSSSGAVETWKVGGDWQVNDTVRFRGTMSFDIRAPNLNDLYRPVGISSTGFTDLLTGGNNSTQLVSSGNATLTPEVARTYTMGVVLTPDFIPGLTMSVDWYQTHMTDAITGITYQSTAVQQICLNSAPAYDSPFCKLATRPIANPADPNYKDPVLNFPTQVFNSPVNSATQQMEGWDIEIDYGWDMDQIISGFPGSMTLRHLLSYQPLNTTVNIPGAVPTWAVAPKTRQTTFLTYQAGDWGLSMQNRWLSGFKKNNSIITATSQNYAVPRVNSYDVMDVTIDRKFDLWGGSADMYLSVENIGDTRAPLTPTNASNPGLFYPTMGFFDDMGRYFTIGIRGNL